jgi:hypothetical protein
MFTSILAHECLKTDSSLLTAVSRLSRNQSQSQSQSYVTTDGQPASLTWNKAPIWGLRPNLDYCLTVASLLICCALSDERTGLSFAIATGARQRSHFWVLWVDPRASVDTVMKIKISCPAGNWTPIPQPLRLKPIITPTGQKAHSPLPFNTPFLLWTIIQNSPWNNFLLLFLATVCNSISNILSQAACRQ